MVMKIEPIAEAIEAIRLRCQHHADERADRRCQVLLMSPQGEPLTSAVARELAATKHLILLCGHYEGVDERVRIAQADRSVSIGGYVLTGGELPAMVLVDSVIRFIPGVIGHAQATDEESFVNGWLEYPQYTRPSVFREMAVPEVLRSGNHTSIARWRRQQSVEQTFTRRPDLVKQSEHWSRQDPRPK